MYIDDEVFKTLVLASKNLSVVDCTEKNLEAIRAIGGRMIRRNSREGKTVLRFGAIFFQSTNPEVKRIREPLVPV